MRRGLLSLCLIGALAGGCPADPRDEALREVVVRVGDHVVGRARVLAELTWAGVARNADLEVRRALANDVLAEVIESEMLLVGAERAGVTVSDEDVARELRRASEGYAPGTFERVLIAEQMTPRLFEERVRRRMVVDAYLRRTLDPGRPIDEAEVVARFAREVAEHGEQVLARQILVKTEEEAEHVLRELRARRIQFDDAARRFSEAPERKDGGLLGWYAKGELPDVFDMAFSLTKGQVSDVVASQYGFHIFELLDRRERGQDALEDARPRLVAELRREREERELTALKATLKKQVPVIVDERALLEVVDALPPAPSVAERGPDPTPNTAQLVAPNGASIDESNAAAGQVPPAPTTEQPVEKGATP